MMVAVLWSLSMVAVDGERDECDDTSRVDDAAAGDAIVIIVHWHIATMMVHMMTMIYHNEQYLYDDLVHV